MNSSLRLAEFKVFFYRIFLIYLAYFISRVLFFLFNQSLFQVEGSLELLKLCFYGLAFDTPALIYTNALFILLSVFPFFVNTHRAYQKVLFYVYFVFNSMALGLNYIDIIYYRFSQTRTTLAVLDLLKSENNKGVLFWNFFLSYWYVVLLFVLSMLFWVFLYLRLSLKPVKLYKVWSYLGFSAVWILIIAAAAVWGIRGDFNHSTRPINMVDAFRHVKTPNQGDIVLNTPFALLRTFNNKHYQTYNFVDSAYITEALKPFKRYSRVVKEKPNVVVFILESMGREYWGSMDNDRHVGDFKGYTPFLDSLAQQSLIFTNAYANGRQSIHAMSSILAGIPSLQSAFTSSAYAKQDIQSVVSIANSLGYETSFFHGAANGSMGFLGFGNILGFQHYYGRTEYNNDKDFDGVWGIWDEPFFKFMGKTLNADKQPFFATMFSITSHDPFIIPPAYSQVFKGGPLAIHKCVQYTDHAMEVFFEDAKKQDWYRNTIFIITADHTNQPYYDYFQKSINRFAVPILFYSPNPEYQLHGKKEVLASQMDIYPSIVDLMGYDKAFRSWGRSLLQPDTLEKPRVVFSPGSIVNFMQGNYTYVFDGKAFIGVYDIKDMGLEKNLIAAPNPEMLKGIKDGKAWMQDYMDRVMHKKLGAAKN